MRRPVFPKDGEECTAMTHHHHHHHHHHHLHRLSTMVDSQAPATTTTTTPANSSNFLPSMMIYTSTTITTCDVMNEISGVACNKHWRRQRQRHHRHLVTHTALVLTACTITFLILLLGISTTTTTLFSVDQSGGVRTDHLNNNPRRIYSTEQHGRALEDEDGAVNNDDTSNSNNNINSAEDVIDGNYSAYRCDDIYTNTPSFYDESSNYDGSDSTSSATTTTTTNKRCQYAKTCENNSGLLFPFVFCHTSFLSPMQFMLLLSPFILLLLTLLFRLLGSTADEYFSPALEMFSSELGLPPRFAGVTLLALGNGASDVSATMNAVWSDPTNGYKMSLGALTGASMFVTTIVAGMVILANGGVICRGALLRDVAALGVTVVVVALSLLGGEVGSATESLFISIYIIYVLIVLIADVYHRAIMLPRLRHEAELAERQRQMNAVDVASQFAGGEAWGAFASSGGGGGGGVVSSSMSTDGIIAVRGCYSDDDRTHISAPPVMEDDGRQPHVSCTTPIIKSRTLNAVLAALSNYNDVANDMNKDSVGGDNRDDANNASMDIRRCLNGWGVESTIEGPLSFDRPVVLHGADGILTRHSHHHPHSQPDGMRSGSGGGEHGQSPYRIMEDMDIVDRLCIRDGSTGYPAYSWVGAWHDGRQELLAHFKEYWIDFMEDEAGSRLEKCLMVLEFPMTIARKLTVSIPCEGSYCRALVAVSFTLSPLWLGVYLLNFGLNLWDERMLIFVSITFLAALMIMRFAPGGDGTMATVIAVPIALYGFVVAATWIDWIADRLVALLDFLGIIFRIPNYIMGLSVLAWGNSMADLSANLTMARKGLANMAITACFAGPVFNILVGLGAGFGVLRSVTENDINYVELSPSITIGFVFCFISCGMLICCGLTMHRGVIPAAYGYAAVVLYTTYVVTSLLLQFLL